MTADNTFPTRFASFLTRYRLVIGLVLLVSFLHYSTAMHIHTLHGIYRRLYYFPIILAAFRGGYRGGLLTSLCASALYFPHAIGLWGVDPAPGIEKFLEMGLYLGVGVLTGTLVDRINASRVELGQTAQNLQEVLDAKNLMEAELVRSARLVAIGRLSAGLAHEIRNPLASIQGSAEVLGDDFPPEHPKAGMLRILLQETQRLNQVLTRFLTFARSEPGETEPFDLVAEVEAVRDLLVHRPQAPKIELQLPKAQPLIALGNPEQARQIILNLGINAAQATGNQGCVTLALEEAPDQVHCLVSDTGPGFGPEDLANFGTPFYSKRSGGTGLGLATSLRLAEDMGGSLTASPGPGGRVVFTLPRPTDA